jgi:proline iminopeptidase
MIVSSAVLASLLSFARMAEPSAQVHRPAQSAAPIAATAPLGELRLIVSDGSQLHVKVAGQGSPCLFVHGGPGQGSASFEQMGGRELEGFVTMIYLDQRGAGNSPNATDYSLDRVVRDIDETRQQLGVEKVCLIAHSFGGILAVEYARRYPERVSRLVMAFSTLHFLSEYNDRMQIAAVNEILDRDVATLSDTADRGAIRAASATARAALMADGQGYRLLTPNPETTLRMSEIDRSYTRSRGYGSAVLALEGTDSEYYRDYAPQTESIQHPVLVLAGTEDYAIGPDEHLKFRFPHQTIVVLETGHLGYFDATPQFVSAIRDFLSAPRMTLD